MSYQWAQVVSNDSWRENDDSIGLALLDIVDGVSRFVSGFIRVQDVVSVVRVVVDEEFSFFMDAHDFIQIQK